MSNEPRNFKCGKCRLSFEATVLPGQTWVDCPKCQDEEDNAMMEKCTNDVRQSLISEMERMSLKYPKYSLDEMYAEYRDALDTLRLHFWRQKIPGLVTWLTGTDNK